MKLIVDRNLDAVIAAYPALNFIVSQPIRPESSGGLD